MKAKRLISSCLVIFLMAGLSGLFSQSVFRVFILKGGASVLRASDSKVANLKIGDRLMPKDKVMLKGDVYVVLNHTDGASLELSKAGNYAVKDLEKKAKAKYSSLIKKYGDYLAKSIEKNSEAEEYTGGLERGLFRPDFTFIMPKTTKVLNKEIGFIWNKVPDAKVYKFKILNENDKVLFEKEIKDTMCAVNFAKLPLDPNTCSFWAVSVDGELNRESEKHCVYPFPKDQDLKVKAELKELNTKFGKKPSAIDLLIMGHFYESYGLLADAYSCFTKAKKLGKGVKEYDYALNSFILRASKYSIER